MVLLTSTCGYQVNSVRRGHIVGTRLQCGEEMKDALLGIASHSHLTYFLTERSLTTHIVISQCK